MPFLILHSGSSVNLALWAFILLGFYASIYFYYYYPHQVDEEVQLRMRSKFSTNVHGIVTSMLTLTVLCFMLISALVQCWCPFYKPLYFCLFPFRFRHQSTNNWADILARVRYVFHYAGVSSFLARVLKVSQYHCLCNALPFGYLCFSTISQSTSGNW